MEESEEMEEPEEMEEMKDSEEMKEPREMEKMGGGNDGKKSGSLSGMRQTNHLF